MTRPRGRGPGRGSEQGGVLVVVMGLIAAMTLLTVVTVRDGYQRHHQARRAHLRSVARNLAEAGIAAELVGRRGGLVGRSVPGLDGTAYRVEVTTSKQRLAGGKVRISSTAVIHGSSPSALLRYLIEGTFERPTRPGGRHLPSSWSERPQSWGR